MSVKRYVAEDMRQALKQIRDELGPDAIILSNRRIEGGVEILTSLDADIAPRQLEEAAAAADIGVTYNARGPVKAPEATLEQQQLSGQAQIDATFEHLLNQHRQSSNQAMPSQNDEQLLVAMRSEIENLRLMLKDQMSHASDERWALKNPLQATVVRRLEEQGVSTNVARKLALQAGHHSTFDESWQATLDCFAAEIPVQDKDLMDQRGVVALLGATGVGKTTTIAKLAIRFALTHGRDQLALVTTDSYRLAAYEQLRNLGRILDVPVRLVDEHNSLNDVLHSLRHKSMVLVDTAGFHPGDLQRAQQLQMLDTAERSIQKLLVLPCTSQGRVLRGIYELMDNVQLDGCILSKVDEADSLGEVLSLVVEKQLSLTYITDGQKIPDDIKPACPEKLVQSLSGLDKSLSGLDKSHSGSDKNLSGIDKSLSGLDNSHSGLDNSHSGLDKNLNRQQPVTRMASKTRFNNIRKPVPVFAGQHL